MFLEKRQVRFATLREFKREGLIGEGLDGTLKFVRKKGARGASEAEIDLLRAPLDAENFDRAHMISFIQQNMKGVGKKSLVRAFVEARRQLALHGDPFEIHGSGRETDWEYINRE